MSKGNEPAYPAANAHRVMQGGLTKRELVAAMAMAGLLNHDPGYAAILAVRHADALLAELERTA